MNNLCFRFASTAEGVSYSSDHGTTRKTEKELQSNSIKQTVESDSIVYITSDEGLRKRDDSDPECPEI
jgi:hypothetical protein